MVELEILFSSGQGILVPMEDRESALRFMQQALEYERANGPEMFHLSTSYEEVLIDLGDISFIRLKKENHPRIGATLKLTAQREDFQHEQAFEASHHDRARPSESPKTEKQAKTIYAGPIPEPQKTYTVDPQGNAFEQAEARLQQVKEQQRKLETEHKKVAEAIRKSEADLEDAQRAAELRQSIESIEIDQEIQRMKDKNNG